MKKKFNPGLLKEELNKFKQLVEYDFYQEKKEMPEYKEIILGNTLEEADETPEEEPETEEIPTEPLQTDNASMGGEMPTDDTPMDDAPMGDTPMGDDMSIDNSGDEVEVDVTSLVKGSEEAKKSADDAVKNTETLIQRLNDLETKLANMSSLETKIDGLEKEFVKRNPTPVEKLEMRSLDSYPFNQKLSDYWSGKEGFYDVTGKDQKKEYVLTNKEIDDTYSDVGIKNTFSVSDEDFEEEDI